MLSNILFGTIIIDVSSSLLGGVVGGVVFMLTIVLMCGFLTGIIAVYVLRRRKEKKQSE